jgi:hypothetical protein
MKRSDMIASLAGYLMDYKTFTGTQFNAKDLAEYVLDCALRKGMLPPTIKHDSRAEAYFNLNEWEPEE